MRRTNPSRRVRQKRYHDFSNIEIDSTISLQTEDDSATTTSTTSTTTTTDRGEPATVSNEEQQSYKFLVALDFGTANTSVSYLKFDPENPPTRLHSSKIKSIKSWPDSKSHAYHTNASAASVPSESWYLNGEYLWGYSVRRKVENPQDPDNIIQSENIIKLAKLLLQDDGATLPNLVELLSRIDKSPDEVIGDYLTEVLRHTKSQLKELEGFRESSSAVEFVICIPAGWSSRAGIKMQIIMEKVAEELDFGYRDFEPYIINEPDAAAAHLLEALEGFDTLEVILLLLFYFFHSIF